MEYDEYDEEIDEEFDEEYLKSPEYKNEQIINNILEAVKSGNVDETDRLISSEGVTIDHLKEVQKRYQAIIFDSLYIRNSKAIKKIDAVIEMTCTMELVGTIVNHSNHKKLNLNNSKATSKLPKSITIFPTNIEELLLSNNNLKELSPDIQLLKSLKSISLNGNQLNELPIEILNLPLLKKLDISNNPLKLIPKSVVASGGLKSILSYYNDISKRNKSVKYDKLKISIISHVPKVGKTLLMQSLADKKISKCENFTGVEITTDLNLSKKLENYSIWEFSNNQPITKHKMYFNSNSVYLLVFKITDKVNEFSTIIQSIKSSITATTPIIHFIGTHCDEIESTTGSVKLDDEKLKIKSEIINTFGNVYENQIHFLSFKNGKGVKEFKKKLINQLEKLELIAELIPQNYILLEKRLGLLLPEIKFISQYEFIEQCKLSYLTDPVEIENVTEFFKKTGTIVPYGDDSFVINPCYIYNYNK